VYVGVYDRAPMIAAAPMDSIRDTPYVTIKIKKQEKI
jgi:hypothetical protein